MHIHFQLPNIYSHNISTVNRGTAVPIQTLESLETL